MRKFAFALLVSFVGLSLVGCATKPKMMDTEMVEDTEMMEDATAEETDM